MGYTTKFEGELLFTKELIESQLAKLKTFLDKDCREHPEWESEHLTYIDLELNDTFSGLKWTGAEKTYDLTEKVNLVIKEMQKDYPDFGLEGELIADGEGIDDRWVLKVENNKATKQKIVVLGTKIVCPHCGEEFLLQQQN